MKANTFFLNESKKEEYTALAREIANELSMAPFGNIPMLDMSQTYFSNQFKEIPEKLPPGMKIVVQNSILTAVLARR